MQQLLRFEQNRSETKATIISKMHSCAQIRRMSSLRLHIYVKYVESCMHMRERESKNLNKIAISKCFFFFFFFFLNISLSWCHDNASLAKPRRSLILHVTRALISFEPIFFFFFEKRKRRFNFVDSFDEARNEDCENITTRRIYYNWTWLNS